MEQATRAAFVLCRFRGHSGEARLGDIPLPTPPGRADHVSVGNARPSHVAGRSSRTDFALLPFMDEIR